MLAEQTATTEYLEKPIAIITSLPLIPWKHFKGLFEFLRRIEKKTFGFSYPPTGLYGIELQLHYQE